MTFPNRMRFIISQKEQLGVNVTSSNSPSQKRGKLLIFLFKEKVNSGFLLGHYLLTPNVCFEFRMVDG